MATDDTHECPAPGCSRQVPGDLLMCRAHWGQVPGALQRAVYRAWDHGKGKGSVEHRRAITAAIRSVSHG